MDDLTIYQEFQHFFLHPFSIALVLILLGVVIYGFYDGLRRRKPFTGREELSGKMGEALTDLHPTGLVLVEGEHWKARAATDFIRKGEEIVVVQVNGMTLWVKRKEIPMQVKQ